MNPSIPRPEDVEKIEVDLPETGLALPSLLEYLRANPTSDSLLLAERVNNWTDEMEGYGVEVNREHKERIIEELTTTGRLSPDTLMGKPPRKEPTL